MENKQEETWTYIRIRKATAQKLRHLKINLDSEMYDDVLDLLLSKYSLEDNRQVSSVSCKDKTKADIPNFKQTGGKINGSTKIVKG